MKAAISNLESDLTQKQAPRSLKEKVIDYYEIAGNDYKHWSPNFNMHFGYFEKGMNPFLREAMLEKQNAVVLAKVGIPTGPSNIGDFGCGLGATMRYGSRHYPDANFKGVTIVPWQVKEAGILNADNPMLQVFESDYCRTPFESNSLDGVYAIESSCYASGSSKSDLLHEMFRVLKPGGRFAISDGFITRPIRNGTLLDTTYKELCNSWALSELANIDHFTACLLELGFIDLQVEDVSLRVAPSVAHVPITVASFLVWSMLVSKFPRERERWDNLKSPLLTMVLGLSRSHFRYFHVSGQKPMK